jgi:hypothetical protein
MAGRTDETAAPVFEYKLFAFLRAFLAYGFGAVSIFVDPPAFTFVSDFVVHCSRNQEARDGVEWRVRRGRRFESSRGSPAFSGVI